MVYTKKIVAVGLLIVALFLMGIQGTLWARSVENARSETDKQNIEAKHPPDEIPGIVGVCLLVAAGVIASIPRRMD
jgi:hypothetical protein